MNQVNYKLQRKQAMAEKYGEPKTLEELFEVLKQAIEDSTTTSPYLIGLAWSVSHRSNISNTHYAPHNGVTNWGCKDGKPKGYSGFSGRVWVRYSRSPDHWGSDSLTHTLTYPGSGGAGSYDGPFAHICGERFRRYGHKDVKDAYPRPHVYSWDFRFFDDDWPLIIDTWIKNHLFNVIETNNANIDINDYQEWHHPDWEARDKEFIASKEKVIE